VPLARVALVERDPVALEYLTTNVAELGLGERVTAIAADVLDPDLPRRIVDAVGGAPVTVVCNPPYVPDGAALAPEAAADPAAALFSGADGLDLIRALAPTLVALVAPGAVVGLEHDDGNGDGAVAALTAAGFAEVTGHRDLAGKPRFATAVAPVH
jgi:release factor glutamine methyltransferase